MMLEMRTGRTRSWAAYFVLLYCAATLLSPHRHLNSITDLITDDQSDSGVVVWARASIAPLGGPLWSEAAILDDDPCLACFWHDTTAAFTPVFPLSIVSVSVATAVVGNPAAPSFAPITPPPSRGPPA